MKPIRITIGRDPDNHLVLADPHISSLHVEINFKGKDEIELIDHSTNGTLVNGKLLAKGHKYYVYPTDQVNLAGVVPLDWEKVNAVKDSAGKTRFTILKTKFFSDLKGVIRTVGEFGEIIPNIQLFATIFLPGSSNKVVALANETKNEKVSPLHFFILSMGFFIFCAVSIPLPEGGQDAPIWGMGKLLQKLSAVNNFEEVFAMMLLVPIIFTGAYVSYLIFKTFVGSTQRWEHFKRLYMLCMGFAFWGFGFALILIQPARLFSLSDSTLVQVVEITLMLVGLHATHVYLLILQTSKKFWKISHTTAFLIVLAKTFILLMLLMFLIKLFRDWGT
jgi:pSer/pThr/pTyr-binding forkhead associated (FHA) protein